MWRTSSTSTATGPCCSSAATGATQFVQGLGTLENIGRVQTLHLLTQTGRIARDLAKVEKTPDAWENKFYAALEDFKYLPAGRIVAGAGTARRRG